ncbi:MAG: hypothetical protein FWE62_05490, partial [Firmicutes bacterium]|nr:hypothetical protein [Bacillota bacterium]
MSLEYIKGLGPARIKTLNEAGIYTAADLAAVLPVSYLDARKLVSSNEAEDGAYVLLRGTLDGVPVTKFVRRGFNLTTVKFRCFLCGGAFSAAWYNQPYIKNIFAAGDFLVFGRAEKKGGKLTFLNPMAERADGVKRLEGILRVYPKIGNIPAQTVADAAEAALARCDFKSV